jgi:hypothetical protein
LDELLVSVIQSLGQPFKLNGFMKG